MANVAVIFAGGVGARMRAKGRPKQFLLVHGKPIIVHTLEVFQGHPEVDGIVVACVENWISYLNEMVYRYRLDKVVRVVPGGSTGQLSIYNALKASEAAFGRDGNVVLIHDGVRPLIDEKTLSKNIASVRKYGSAITTVPAKETVVLIDKQEHVSEIVERPLSRIARAPQSFWLDDILSAHEKAVSDGVVDSIDSCTLMARYGYTLSIVEGELDNIKITTPEDFYAFRAIHDARENDQLG